MPAWHAFDSIPALGQVGGAVGSGGVGVQGKQATHRHAGWKQRKERNPGR